MTQIELPCLFMRAGTSRGPFFNAADLPRDTAARDAVLLAALGSSEDGRQLDGVGGGDSLTSKVAIVGRSSATDADVDYQFVQVATDGAYVDATPACGNMLSGVGPFAIATGMVPAGDGATPARTRARPLSRSSQRPRASLASPGRLSSSKVIDQLTTNSSRRSPPAVSFHNDSHTPAATDENPNSMARRAAPSRRIISRDSSDASVPCIKGTPAG